MSRNRIQFNTLWIVIFVSILFSGCAGLRPERSNCHDRQAFKLAYSVKKINKNINSYTGIGWLTVTDKGRINKFRVAFAALNPDKIRLTLMTTGFPVATIIADGKKVLFLSHTKKYSLYKINSSNSSLKSILSIPVNIRDIISLLSGQIPLKEFDSACFAIADVSNGHVPDIHVSDSYTSGVAVSKSDGSETIVSGEKMLILKKKWGNMVQHMIFNSSNIICKYELLTHKQKLIYSVSFAKFKYFGIFRIPFKIKINNGSDRNLILEITDYRVNSPVKNSVFSLTESG